MATLLEANEVTKIYAKVLSSTLGAPNHSYISQIK